MICSLLCKDAKFKPPSLKNTDFFLAWALLNLNDCHERKIWGCPAFCDEIGVHANAALRIDPVIKNTCLSDVTGGSAVFYDTN
jgi:hypothetical protein